jgi:hypothetical protein
MLVAALGTLAAHFGYGEAKRLLNGMCDFGRLLLDRRAEIGSGHRNRRS